MNREHWPAFECLPDAVDVEVFADKADWLEARRKYVTASDVAKLFGASSYGNLFTMYVSKVFKDLLPTAPEAVLETGNRWQPYVLAEFAKDTGYEVLPVPPWHLVTNPEYPGLAATLDGVYRRVDERGRVHYGPVEAKMAGRWKAADWRGEPPIGFLCQSVAQMMACGLRERAIAGLIGGSEFCIAPGEWNEAHAKAIMNKVFEFQAIVHAGLPPEPDGSEATKRALDLLFDAPVDDRIALPAEAAEWAAEREQASARKAEAEAAFDTASAKIRLALGNHTVGYYPGGEFRWKIQGGKPKRLTVALGLAAELDKAGIPYKVESSPVSRVLRHKPLKGA